MDISNLFEMIEREIGGKISLANKFRLAQYDSTNGLCYTVGEITKPLDFFIEKSKDLHFIQEGDFYELDDLDIEKPFWAIEKISKEENFFKTGFLHELYYYSAVV